MKRSPKHLLMTGMPGVGKTTVIRRVAEQLTDVEPGGFYTEEIREDGIRQGFRLRSFDGREWLIAHVTLSKRCHVSKYGVDVDAIDAAVGRLLCPESDAAIYLVDEVGKMECCSTRFIEAMRRLLQSNSTVIATIGKKGTGFITEVKQRHDCLLWEITPANRDTMPQKVLRWLEETAAPSAHNETPPI